MTREQKKAVRHALRNKEHRPAAWNEVIRQTMDYYAAADPVCAELLQQRYLDGVREETVIRRLYIGRTTYYHKELEVLSTVAVLAAARGLL